MRKQTLILTGWLTLPFLALTLLMVWIFTSLDKDRLMAGAPPVGAGAGDTGNANALGEWLAGRDPDAVSDAIDARRERRAIDPLDWPGGVLIRVPQSAIAPNDKSGVLIMAKQGNAIPGRTTGMTLDTQGYFTATFREVDNLGPLFFVGRGIRKDSVHPREIADSDGRRLRAFLLPRMIPDPGLQVSDPIVVTLEVDSVYVGSMP